MNMNSEQARLKFMLEKIIENIDKLDVVTVSSHVLAAECVGIRLSIQLEGEE